MLLTITIQHFAAHYAAMLQSWSELFWIWDIALICIGLVFLCSARRSYRAFIMANCAALGWYLAMFLAHWSWIAGATAALIGTVLGVLLVPMLRLALFVLGAIAGGAAGVALWHVFKQPPDYRWVPAILGVLVLGVAGLYIFEACAVIICTLEGAVMIVIGSSGMIMRYGTANIRDQFIAHVAKQPVNLMAIIIGLCCLGILVQLAWAAHDKEKEKNASD